MKNLFLLLLSMALGSFNSVLITRIPQNLSILGRSECPYCKDQIAWHRNIPIISYLLLGGRCHKCKKKIPKFYISIEIFTLVLCILVLNLTDSFILQLSFVLFTSISLSLTIIDWKTFTLPNKLTYSLFIMLITLISFESFLQSDWRLIQRCMIVSMLLMSFYFLIYFISRGGMGLGDVKYAASLGLIVGQFGYLESYYATMLSFFFGAIYGIYILIKASGTRKSVVPFGPFMFIGTYILLFSKNFT